MDIHDCIRLTKILDCIPFYSSEEEGNFNSILVQAKLMEAAYKKSLSLNENLEQTNPIKVRSHHLEKMPPCIKDEPKRDETWYYTTEQICSQRDLSYYLEESADLLPFYSLALVCAMNFSSIREIDDDDIETYLTEFQDWYLEFMSSEEEFELLVSTAQDMRAEVILTEQNGYSNNPLIKKLVHELDRCYLYGIISEKAICENLGSYILAFMTYGYYNAEVHTVANSLLARYLKVKDSIVESEMKNALDKAIERFYEPISCGLYGLEPIIAQSDSWVAVTYVFGGTDAGGMFTEDNRFPFWVLSLNIMDTLLPIILEGIQ